MALGDFTQREMTNYETGAIAEVMLPDGVAGSLSLDVTTPPGSALNIPGVASSAHPKAFFNKTYAEGIYRWKTSDGRHEGAFAVNPPGEEADLIAAEIESLAKESSPGLATAGGGSATIVAGSVANLLTQLEQRSEGTSLTPGFVSLVLIFALTEPLIANRCG